MLYEVITKTLGAKCIRAWLLLHRPLRLDAGEIHLALRLDVRLVGRLFLLRLLTGNLRTLGGAAHFHLALLVEPRIV